MKKIITALLLFIGLNASAQSHDKLQEGIVISSYEETISAKSKIKVYLIVDKLTGNIFESVPTTLEFKNGSVIVYEKSSENYTQNNPTQLFAHNVMQIEGE